MRLFRKLTLLALIGFTIASTRCTKVNNEQSIPSYIEVEQFVLSTNSAEGTNSHNIVDAWIFVDDQLMGVFELPARVPTLRTGVQNIKIFPGIKNNGQSDNRVRYPFYTYYDSSIDLVPDSTVIINPEIGYISDIDIWEENFANVHSTNANNEVGFEEVAAYNVSTNERRYSIPKCNHCGKPGHLEEKCWFKNNNSNHRDSWKVNIHKS